MLDKHNTGSVQPPPCRTQNFTKYNFVKVVQQGEKSLSAGTTKYAEHQLVTKKLNPKGVKNPRKMTPSEVSRVPSFTRAQLFTQPDDSPESGESYGIIRIRRIQKFGNYN